MTENEIIAEFMGGVYSEWNNRYKFGKGRKWSYPHLLKYDTSWDWLMPVVERINKSWQNFANENKIDANAVLAMPDALIRIRINLPRVDIFVVHKAVVEFIKWYNQTKQK